MKIIRDKSREYNGKAYYKNKINIPDKILEEAKIKPGEDLKIEVKNGKIMISKQ